MISQIISTGEKLKSIRKTYHIKQNQLCGDKITRNMISMIENNKCGLSKNTATLILKNIQRICAEKDIECSVTLSYLLESEVDQAKKIVDDLFSTIESSDLSSPPIEKSMNYIQLIIDKYKLDYRKVEIYTLLALKYKKSKDYYNAYTYYVRALESLEHIFDNEKALSLLVNITYCSNNLGEYNQSLHFNKLAYTYVSNVPAYYDYKLRFNKLLSLKNLKRFDCVLDEIFFMETAFNEKISNDLREEIDLTVLKANCYKEKRYYTDAISLHRHLLTLEIDIEMKLMTFCNLIEIYISLNDSINVKRYVDMCIACLPDYEFLCNKNYEAEILLDIALGFELISDHSSCRFYLLESVRKSKTSSNANLLNCSFEKLIDITSSHFSSEEMDRVKNMVLESISLGYLKDNKMCLLKLIKHYSRSENMTTINDIITFIENI